MRLDASRAVLILALASCGDRRPPELREFDGAYPEAAHPNGTVRAYTLTAAPAVVPTFDGRPLKVWAYDGQVPGPTLRVKLGETLKVTFTNKLPQPTTIHWHGVRLPNAMDGTPGITQPAIQTGETFVYEFTPKDAGTFWFHPHLRASEQVERGLYGLLIVEDAQPLPWSRELTWVLDDWLLGPDGEIFPEFNTPHDLAHDGRWGNLITVNGDLSAHVAVKPGERIRLRMVDVANGRVFQPDFGPLEAKIIAVDGMYAERPLAAGFQLAPGNRLDVDLTIPLALRGQSVPIVDRYYQPQTLVTLDVGTDAVETPRFASPAHAHLPAWKNTAALPVRVEYKLNAQRGGKYGIQWTLNGEAFDHEAHEGHVMPHTSQRLPYGQFSKVRFTNESFRLHPMHLHGQFFKVLARNGVPVDEGHWRDTVLVKAKETVDVGLVPEDEGVWMLHCHILEHAESGMMTTFEVRR
jgi:FtsP/CotA-like multicopper oxidase with cupredoxin domain